MKQTRETLLVALFTAFLIAGAFIRIPLPPVPITLQTLFVFLLGLVATPKKALESSGLYLILGMIGIPVFTFGGGIGNLLAQPSGGFLFGMVLASTLMALIVRGETDNKVKMILALIAGEVAIYLCGIPYLHHLLLIKKGEFTWKAAIAAGLTPFIAGDVLKMVAAFLLAPMTKNRVDRFLETSEN